MSQSTKELVYNTLTALFVAGGLFLAICQWLEVL